MAGINFINISIVDSLKRTKEVVLRNITGSSRDTIILQFTCELGLICLVAFIFDIFQTNISLPVFNNLAGKLISFGRVYDIKLISNFTVLFVIIVLCTGFYHACMLSRFRPKEVEFNKQKLSGRNLGPVYQFMRSSFAK